MFYMLLGGLFTINELRSGTLLAVRKFLINRMISDQPTQHYFSQAEILGRIPL
jgi:hypothetical protein